MTFFQDYITFSLDKRFEDTTKSGIISVSPTWIDPEESERFVHKRVFGTIVSIPVSYSDTKVSAIDPGLPAPKVFVGHEWIQDMVNRGYKNHSNKDYYPSTYDGFEFITLADIGKKCDVKVGDVVYFDEKVTEFENYLGLLENNTKEHFRARIDEIFCVIRNGKIIMQGGWVLVEPDMETWAEITTRSGIIKKTKPEAKALKAKVCHSNATHLHVGQNIIYKNDADWVLKIEGKEYYVIQEQDILGEN